MENVEHLNGHFSQLETLLIRVVRPRGELLRRGTDRDGRGHEPARRHEVGQRYLALNYQPGCVCRWRVVMSNVAASDRI